MSKDRTKELETRMSMIRKAVEAQANDEGLWCEATQIGEAYMQHSLRQLHRVIESGDEIALQDIIKQARGDIYPL